MVICLKELILWALKMKLEDWSDVDLRAELLAIDVSDNITVTEWEANFIESICYDIVEEPYKLSEKQRSVIINMIEKYKDQLE